MPNELTLKHSAHFTTLSSCQNRKERHVALYERSALLRSASPSYKSNYTHTTIHL